MAKKQTAEPQAPEEAPARIKVQVGAMPINEGVHLPPGTIFETTPERAAALGPLVTPV
jgi:hypothetical protein